MDMASFLVKLNTQGGKKKENFPEGVISGGKKKCKKELFMVRTRGRAFPAEKQLVDDLRKVTSFRYKEQSKDQCCRNIMSRREGQEVILETEAGTGSHRDAESGVRSSAVSSK